MPKMITEINDLQNDVANLHRRVTELEDALDKQLKANHLLADKVVELAKGLKNHHHIIG